MRFEFSNFTRSPVTVEGLTYATAEAAYQSGKTDDPEWKRRLAATTNPVIAKRLGRRVPLKPGWDRVAEMEKVLRAKFAQGTEWATRLLATWDRELVEANTHHDRWWGRCDCPRCGGKGENQLGKLLMKLRDELRKNAPTSTADADAAAKDH